MSKQTVHSKSIHDIESELQGCTGDRTGLYQLYASDERTGVQKLLAKYKKQDEKLASERLRIQKMRTYEEKYHDYEYICGIDEVGRGPLAGPVVAGAVILPKDCEILYINDSKQLSAKKREELCEEIKAKAIAIGIGIVSPAKIDEINILQATYMAMREAISNLSVTPQVLLNDAVTIPEVTIPQVPIIKGDAKSVSIAAASIVAKVTRDHLMEEYDRVLPGYGFAKTSGKNAEDWSSFIDDYIMNSPELALICLLIDSRHPNLDIDEKAYAWIGTSGVPVLVIGTKGDKLKASEKQQNRRKLASNYPSVYPPVIYSSLKGTGKGEVLHIIESIVCR